MSNQGDLVNILITGAILFVILILAYLIYRIFVDNKAKHELDRIKNLTVFQISIPKQVAPKQNEPPKDFRETIGVAEQFFSSLANLYESGLEQKMYKLQTQVVLEMISWEGKLEFYCIVPNKIANVVERQINSYWPTSQIEKTTIPNIFEVSNSALVACNLKLKKKFVLPIKTYKYLESDPLNSISNSLSKLGPKSGAAIQLILSPIKDDWRKVSGIMAHKVQKGKSIASETWYMKAMNFVFDLLSGIMHGKDKPKTEGPDFKQPVQLTPMQDQVLKMLNEKSSKTALGTNIRIVTTSPTREEAILNLKNITTAFAQFSTPELNGFKGKIAQSESVRDYILRRFTGKGMILNSEELASIFHLPTQYVDTPNIAWAQAKEMPPPTNLPNEGTILGKSVFRGEEKPIHIKQEDRRRHIFMIGKTGVGKTTLFSNMIEQDMREGKGCCFVDPLGDAIEDLLGKVPPERIKDVILFDPSDIEFPVGLNLLEYKSPDQKDFLIQESIQIFYKLFDPGQTGIVGPQWEHWFRNAALTIMNQPDGGTLIDVPRIFTDDGFRTKLVSLVTDPIVKAFWTQQLAKTADFHKSEMYNYFISKFGRFMTNDLMRNIIGQKRSTFDFRKVMDEGKILLINLSKGKIGEVNSNLLGMILVSKIQMAAFSRADIPEENRKDFCLYVDEFQNFTTDSFATILSEARKYRLNLNITNQYIAQLTEKIRDAVIGNVGTMIVYRIGAADAEFMVKEFPNLTVEDMANLDKFNTYTKLLIDGTPSKPFSMHGLKSEYTSDANIREQARNWSRQNHARTRSDVEKEIGEQIKSMGEVTAPGQNEPLKSL